MKAWKETSEEILAHDDERAATIAGAVACLMSAARQEERARIIAWLRKESEDGDTFDSEETRSIADTLEDYRDRPLPNEPEGSPERVQVVARGKAGTT